MGLGGGGGGLSDIPSLLVVHTKTRKKNVRQIARNLCNDSWMCNSHVNYNTQTDTIAIMLIMIRQMIHCENVLWKL